MWPGALGARAERRNLSGDGDVDALAADVSKIPKGSKCSYPEGACVCATADPCTKTSFACKSGKWRELPGAPSR